MAELNTMNIFIGAFIAILIGVVFVQVVANNIEANRELSNTVNESITLAVGGLSGETANENLHALNFFGNATNSTHSPDINVGTEVNWTKNGSITVSGDPAKFDTARGPYNISYSYEGDLYVTNSISRTLLGLVTIFFVLGIVAIGIFMIRKSYPDLF